MKATHSQYVRGAWLLNDIGTVHHRKHDFETAMKCYTESLEMRSEAIDVLVCAQSEHPDNSRSFDEMQDYLQSLSFCLENHIHTKNPKRGMNEQEFVQLTSESASATSMMIDEEGPLHGLPAQESSKSSMRFLSEPLHIYEHCFSFEGNSDQGEVGGDALSVTYFNLALVHFRLQNFEKVAYLLEMAADSLQTTDTKLFSAMLHSNLGYIQYQDNQYDCANISFDEAVLLMLLGANDKRFASPFRSSSFSNYVHAIMTVIILNAAEVYLNIGRYEDALSLCNQMLQENKEGMNGSLYDNMPPAPLKIQVDQEIVVSHQARAPGRTSSASQDLNSRLANLHVATALHGIGEAFLHHGDLQDALKALARTLFIRSNLLGEMHSDTAKTTYLLGRLLHDREDYVDALGMYQRALAAQLSAAMERPNSDFIDVLNSMCNIARVQNMSGKFKDAMQTCNQALQLSRLRLEQGEAYSEFTLVLLQMKCVICQEMGSNQEAMEAFAAAHRIRQHTEGDSGLPPLMSVNYYTSISRMTPHAAAA